VAKEMTNGKRITWAEVRSFANILQARVKPRLPVVGDALLHAVFPRLGNPSHPRSRGCGQQTVIYTICAAGGFLPGQHPGRPEVTKAHQGCWGERPPVPCSSGLAGASPWPWALPTRVREPRSRPWRTDTSIFKTGPSVLFFLFCFSAVSLQTKRRMFSASWD